MSSRKGDAAGINTEWAHDVNSREICKGNLMEDLSTAKQQLWFINYFNGTLFNPNPAH